MNDINDKISKMAKNLVFMLNMDEDASIGVSAMIHLIVNISIDNENTKESFLQELARAWDHYKEKRG